MNTGGNQDTTGNAATATRLATARDIGGVSFDGSAAIDLPGVNTGGNQDTTGNAATASRLKHSTATFSAANTDYSSNNDDPTTQASVTFWQGTTNNVFFFPEPSHSTAIELLVVSTSSSSFRVRSLCASGDTCLVYDMNYNEVTSIHHTRRYVMFRAISDGTSWYSTASKCTHSC